MRLKDYGRNHKKRKEYIKQSGLLLVGRAIHVIQGQDEVCRVIERI